MDNESLSQKKSLRFLLRSRRIKAAQENVGVASSLHDIFANKIKIQPQSVIGFYYPQRSEMDPLLLVTLLSNKGHRLVLPCIEEEKAGLVFRLYNLGDKLETGDLAIPQPPVSAPALDPDFLFVPLLGFDRLGQRLGQGGGYYDRTLAMLRKKKKIVAVGLAYAAQEISEIPCEKHDQKLDFIVTEKELIDLEQI